MLSLPRLCAAVFAVWAVVFVFFPGWTNELAAVGDVPGKHAQDWTQLVGLLSLGFAILLNDVHRSGDFAARRLVARGMLAFALPCAVLMTYWQMMPDRRWFRLDIVNVVLLYAMSYAGFLMSRRPTTDNRTASPRARE